MIYQAPFSLRGEAGKALGSGWNSFEALGVLTAALHLRSLDAGELVFTQRAKAGRVIPDDGEWLTLRDDEGTILFRGLAKRSFSYAGRIYSFKVSDSYKGLMETPLLEGDRAYVLYDARDLGALVLDIYQRGISAGLPMQAPAAMPAFFNVPKMAFRSASIAGAIEDALKWDPSCVTRMDHASDPQTLRFSTRGEAAEMMIDLDADGHGVSDITLTPYPEARALSVSFAYARRDGDDVVLYLVQSAGDDSAEASRSLSLYLSGQERSDMLVTEALTTAQKAVAMAQAAVDAIGAEIDAAAASAQIPLTWAGIKPLDSRLVAAETALPGFTMSTTSSGGSLFSRIQTTSGGALTDPDLHYSATPVYLAHSNDSAATGWYPIVSGAFTDLELTTAGATKTTKFLRGEMYAIRTGDTALDAGQQSLVTSAPAQCHQLGGWTQGVYNPVFEDSDLYARRMLWYEIEIEVDAINMAPTAVAAAVKAAAGSGSSALITRADFVEAPDDLAFNYFTRQNWTPYKGEITLTPSAPRVPMPGDFISVRGAEIPAEWATMKVPVAETSIDLVTLAAAVTVGPSPRQDFSSLVDRLRIPQEDNYQPG